MSPCPMTYNDVVNMKKFGAITENNCEFNLDQLINPSLNLHYQNGVLYELFLKDDKDMMVDVPVLIRNYKNPLGASPNVGDIPLDTWRFTRRFTIFDAYTGISETNGFLSGYKPKYVRWADTVKIKVTLDPT